MSVYPPNRLFPPWLNASAEKGERSEGPAVIFLRLIVASRGNPDNPLDLSELRFDASLAGAVRSFQIGLGFEGDNVDGSFGQATRATLKYLRGIDVETIPAKVFHVGLLPTWWAGPHHKGLLPWPLESVVGPCPGCARMDAFVAIDGSLRNRASQADTFLKCVACGYGEQVTYRGA